MAFAICSRRRESDRACRWCEVVDVIQDVVKTKFEVLDVVGAEKLRLESCFADGLTAAPGAQALARIVDALNYPSTGLAQRLSASWFVAWGLPLA